jgi:large subunit ribosomal protein L21
VEPGQVVEVDHLALQTGDAVTFDRVLLASDDSGVRVGNPTVAGASVTGQVVGEFRTRKVLVFKYKPKERYRRLTSARRSLTRVRIDSIAL